MKKEYEIPKIRVSRKTGLAASIAAITAACILIYQLHNSLTFTELMLTTLSPILIYLRIVSSIEEANDAERRYKLTLVPEGICYRWPGNESRLLFNDVVSVKVMGNRHLPKSIIFKMKNGVLHEITKYEGMKEILLHVEAKLPFTLFSYES